MVNEVGELKIEHLLLFVIVGFLLYHLMGKCGCSGNGFSVGGQTKCNKNPIYLEYKGCEKKETSNCTDYYSDGYDDGKRNCIVENNKCITDMSHTCKECVGEDEKCDSDSDCCKPSDPYQYVFCRGGSTTGDPTAHCRWG